MSDLLNIVKMCTDLAVYLGTCPNEDAEIRSYTLTKDNLKIEFTLLHDNVANKNILMNTKVKYCDELVFYYDLNSPEGLPPTYRGCGKWREELDDLYLPIDFCALAATRNTLH